MGLFIGRGCVFDGLFRHSVILGTTFQTGAAIFVVLEICGLMTACGATIYGNPLYLVNKDGYLGLEWLILAVPLLCLFICLLALVAISRHKATLLRPFLIYSVSAMWLYR